jgi:hypothetical protein
MNLSRRGNPEWFHMDKDLYWYLFGFLAFGDDLDDLIFYGEHYFVSER